MRTVTGQSNGAKGLRVIGVAVTALAIGAWILPSAAQMERGRVGPIHTPAEIASDGNADGILGVDISFPAAVQDGQYCVAYGLAWGGTPPYEFYWSGAFSNGDAEPGPLGPNQIASGYVSAGGTMRLSVRDANGVPGSVGLSFDAQDEYNPECEG